MHLNKKVDFATESSICREFCSARLGGNPLGVLIGDDYFRHQIFPGGEKAEKSKDGFDDNYM